MMSSAVKISNIIAFAANAIGDFSASNLQGRNRGVLQINGRILNRTYKDHFQNFSPFSSAKTSTPQPNPTPSSHLSLPSLPPFNLSQISRVFYFQIIISVTMKSGRGKENTQNVNNQFVSSTYRVESDQKDLIIKALRSDHENLKKNEVEYHQIHEQYKQLQNKYKLLNDEKINDDRDFKMKHEAAVRNIGQLKNQIDALRSELRDKKLEINDLESDSSSLKQQFDEKNIELENFKNDFKGCIADSQELAAERESLANASTKLRGIIGQLQDEDRLLKDDNDSVNKRLDELERYQGQLILQEKILRDKIQGYENENNELDSSINELCDELSELELAIKKAQDELTDLQQATSELGLLNDKYKTECQHVQKSTQAEIMKNNNLIKDLKNAEYTEKVRNGQIEQASGEVETLKGETDSLGHINSKLGEDLQACMVHLQNLGLINSKLVEHLQNFSSEDEQVRQLINRKPRVQACRNRVSEVQKSTFSYTSDKYSCETRLGSARREYR